jgi:hypothetical protein
VVDRRVLREVNAVRQLGNKVEEDAELASQLNTGFHQVWAGVD